MGKYRPAKCGNCGAVCTPAVPESERHKYCAVFKRKYYCHGCIEDVQRRDLKATTMQQVYRDEPVEIDWAVDQEQEE